jgi:hypothetical protein
MRYSTTGNCLTADCRKPRYMRGLCRMHYNRQPYIASQRRAWELSPKGIASKKRWVRSTRAKQTALNWRESNRQHIQVKRREWLTTSTKGIQYQRRHRLRLPPDAPESLVEMASLLHQLRKELYK